MVFKLNPIREAAILASQRAETALDEAEKAVQAARGCGEMAVAYDRLDAARRTAQQARAVVAAEYQKARIENGDGPDPLVPHRG
ncbi:hypothetical protein ABZ547_34325 [Streptomyces sparsogenes]|uniref:hypothetical protein n=1 Tax=Streptomyces sparsogenes TaxID=67365 RepID=UPI00340EE2FC